MTNAFNNFLKKFIFAIVVTVDAGADDRLLIL